MRSKCYVWLALAWDMHLKKLVYRTGCTHRRCNDTECDSKHTHHPCSRAKITWIPCQKTDCGCEWVSGTRMETKQTKNYWAHLTGTTNGEYFMMNAYNNFNMLFSAVDFLRSPSSSLSLILCLVVCAHICLNQRKAHVSGFASFRFNR